MFIDLWRMMYNGLELMLHKRPSLSVIWLFGIKFIAREDHFHDASFCCHFIVKLFLACMAWQLQASLVLILMTVTESATSYTDAFLLHCSGIQTPASREIRISGIS